MQTGHFARAHEIAFVPSFDERQLPTPLVPSCSRSRSRNHPAVFRLRSSYHSHICKPNWRTVWKLQAPESQLGNKPVRWAQGPLEQRWLLPLKLAWPSRPNSLVPRDQPARVYARASQCMVRECIGAFLLHTSLIFLLLFFLLFLSSFLFFFLPPFRFCFASARTTPLEFARLGPIS